MLGLKSLIVAAFASVSAAAERQYAANCLTFTVGAGTGCAWMCQYCATNLGTANYYFTTPVCAYSSGGCIGDPQVGVPYTCCAL
jgi:hypothetical protein